MSSKFAGTRIFFDSDDEPVKKKQRPTNTVGGKEKAVQPSSQKKKSTSTKTSSEDEDADDEGEMSFTASEVVSSTVCSIVLAKHYKSRGDTMRLVPASVKTVSASHQPVLLPDQPVAPKVFVPTVSALSFTDVFKSDKKGRYDTPSDSGSESSAQQESSQPLMSEIHADVQVEVQEQETAPTGILKPDAQDESEGSAHSANQVVSREPDISAFAYDESEKLRKVNDALGLQPVNELRDAPEKEIQQATHIADPVFEDFAQPKAAKVVQTQDEQKQGFLIDSQEAIQESPSSYADSIASVPDSMEEQTPYQILNQEEERRVPPYNEGCFAGREIQRMDT